jgi:ABC-type multidrug transport system fused ATPase/permease subunit
MTGQASILKHDPRKLCYAYFKLAKRLWGTALLCKLAIILTGGLVVWFSVFAKAAPFVAFMLAIFAEWIGWRSDKAKGVAETLLRKLDFRDSLGWEISKAELSDVLARTSAKIRSRIPPEDGQDSYFASRDEHGTVRALRNIQESAWWSKHLAEKMGQYAFVLTIVCVIGSLFVLIASISSAMNSEVLSSIGRVVTSVLMLVLSLGLVRLTLGYYGFSRKAQRAEERAGECLKHECGELEVIKLYNEYHLDRASTPLIPDWVWKFNQEHLNELWSDYRSS